MGGCDIFYWSKKGGVYAESDEERQRILESAGWKFYRIKYSDWINSKFDRYPVALDIAKLLR